MLKTLELTVTSIEGNIAITQLGGPVRVQNVCVTLEDHRGNSLTYHTSVDEQPRIGDVIQVPKVAQEGASEHLSVQRPPRP